ncbi:AAA family ATPase [Comamonas sp. CMM03]|uniref:non-canonical purine NTP pyrophosphatase n=1 Tax=Comamonas sp. CMM03 TaxID=2854781 RepID=UPI001C43D40F|nr:non-canonical purine NTP pyrophosphatase [Comamonas sp. CMM03]MBV7417173.1 AAA family ATPase [Comamonas sp. CMM03]
MIEVVFFSTNRSKLAHFRYLGEKVGVRVKGFHETTYYASYNEPKIDDRSELLKLSYESALEQWLKRQGANADDHSTFFFEDTSVVIEALSKDTEVPGVNVKYWMRDMTFEKLDTLLKRAGNNRKVIVRSDIVMHLPQRWRTLLNTTDRYLSVVGESHGVIADCERKIQPNLVYPWLDDKTFNKWFVPVGASGPISMLDIKEADLSDFRARAFEKITSVLHGKLSFLANRDEPGADQLQIPGIATYPSIFVICGPSCAGKSTTANWMRDKYELLHIEASDFMYKAFWERHGPNPGVSIGNFAEAALQTQPGIVAQPIAHFLREIGTSGAVITGFRSTKEVEIFQQEVGSDIELALMYLDASAPIRLKRALERGRDGVTPEKFVKRDEQEVRMGVSGIAELPNVERQNNEGSLRELYAAVRTRYREALRVYTSDKERRTQRQQLQRDQLEGLILRTLLAERPMEKWLTTTEIAAALNRRFNEVKSKNNVSRYFNQEFHPYYELRFRERDGKRTGVLEYRLSATGISRAMQMHAAPEVRQSRIRRVGRSENTQLVLALPPPEV